MNAHTTPPTPDDILVVDDTLANLKLLRDILKEAGYRVRTANDGELALRTVQAKPPIIILLDIRMPGLSGLEVSNRLKAAAKSREIPIIFISALTSQQDKVQGFEAGGVDYITKPFDKAEVLARVHTHVKLRQALLAQEILAQRLQAEVDHRLKAEVDMKAAKEAAEAANRAKSVFLANMSHELRTPMNAILGFTQLMQRDPRLGLEHQKNLATINRSGTHLLALINDVLSISKIETGEIELNETPFDLLRMLTGLEELIQISADTKGINLNIERSNQLPRYVLSDEHKLQQVLTNLLNNAIKFTKAGGTVTLGISAVQSQGDRVQISFCVEDTGIGISPAEQAQIFETFSQAKAGEISGEGSGLGLSISREFIRLLHGRLSLKSIPGQGSRFQFSIPLTVTSEEEMAQDGAVRQVTGLAFGVPAYRILIVEDTKDSRQLLYQLLQQVGFKVREACNGEEAISQFQQWHPQLILMDMRMPVLNGYEATRRIKATPEGRKTIIIALTASVLEEDRALVLSAGCDDFVHKPVEAWHIFHKIAKYLKLEYEYADTDPLAATTKQIPLDETFLAQVPEEVRRELRQAALALDVERAQRVVDTLMTIDSTLGSGVNRLIEEFRFDELQRLTETSSNF